MSAAGGGGCNGSHGGCYSFWITAKDWDGDDDSKGLWMVAVATNEREKLGFFFCI